ncbi:Amidase, partial [Clostridium grantii DSM 8605]
MNVSSLLLKFKNVLDKGYSLNLARYDGVRYGYRTKEFDDVYDMMIKSRTEAFGKEVKRSHIQTLIAMNEKSNNACSKELSEYIEQVSREDIWKELLKLDNKIIMAFLYSKYSTAKENHIHMEVEI